MDKMTSVHSTAHRVYHRLPALTQAFKLQRLALVKLGDFFELGDLLQHQRQIAKRPQPGARHFGIAAQRVAAEDDALIGFFCGHNRISWQNPQAVNGGANG